MYPAECEGEKKVTVSEKLVSQMHDASDEREERASESEKQEGKMHHRSPSLAVHMTVECVTKEQGKRREKKFARETLDNKVK